jgi:hypothetical protein
VLQHYTSNRAVRIRELAFPTSTTPATNDSRGVPRVATDGAPLDAPGIRIDPRPLWSEMGVTNDEVSGAPILPGPRPAHGYVRGMLSRTSEDHRTTRIASRCGDPWQS